MLAPSFTALNAAADIAPQGSKNENCSRCPGLRHQRFRQCSGKAPRRRHADPHAEILELIKPTLAKEGVDLQIKVFTDYVQPNVQVAEKRLDANYFQTLPYLENFNKGKGTNLVTVVGVHVEPLRWLFEEIQVAGRVARRRHRRHSQRTAAGRRPACSS